MISQKGMLYVSFLSEYTTWQAVIFLLISIFEKEVNMTRKGHNHRPQTNPLHHKEETQSWLSHDSKNTNKIKQPALSISARWLQN